jgi:hypothetical protein
MARKKVSEPRLGTILVRNMDLDVWAAYKDWIRAQLPEAIRQKIKQPPIAPFLVQTLRDEISRSKQRR